MKIDYSEPEFGEMHKNCICYDYDEKSSKWTVMQMVYEYDFDGNGARLADITDKFEQLTEQFTLLVGKDYYVGGSYMDQMNNAWHPYYHSKKVKFTSFVVRPAAFPSRRTLGISIWGIREPNKKETKALMEYRNKVLLEKLLAAKSEYDKLSKVIKLV